MEQYQFAKLLQLRHFTYVMSTTVGRYPSWVYIDPAWIHTFFQTVKHSSNLSHETVGEKNFDVLY